MVFILGTPLVEVLLRYWRFSNRNFVGRVVEILLVQLRVTPKVIVIMAPKSRASRLTYI